ncbi:MAG: adenylate/guanylate cyclase domain-containing protein [Alphaproteobacteria bacterium]|nr:adenylate/guanylate cyclase domain-containing protein [Alphaproteobacteria bacterium]
MRRGGGIGLKIFGIAIILLALMVAAALYSNLKLAEVQRPLLTLGESLVPLADRIAQVDDALLHQDLVIERLFAGHLDAAAARASFVRYNATIDDLLAASARLVEHGLSNAVMDGSGHELARLESLVAKIAQDHGRYRRRAEETMAAMAGGRSERAITLAEVLEADEDSINDLVGDVLREIQAYNELNTVLIGARQEEARRATLLLTGFATMVGLLLAYLVTRGLLRPMARLVKGAEAVEAGRLDIELVVSSRDEIGQLTVAFNHMVGELRAKERIKETFGQYVDPRVVEGLIGARAEAASAGERQLVTCFFSDLAGFTAIGERLTPPALVALLNEYFSAMTGAIRAEGGLIDKYIGDAIMAFWGPPFCVPPDQATQACRAALAQFSELVGVQSRLPDVLGLRTGLPVIGMRVGLATGEVVVGSIGPTVARSYTIIGDTVNLGSRLEGANKAYGTRILICERTRQMAGTTIEAREIDRLAVVGRSEPVRAFELLGRAGAVAPDVLAGRDRFEDGLARYRERDWSGAETGFRGCLAAIPGDRPATLYLERIAHFRASPPQADWDGVWHLEKK